MDDLMVIGALFLVGAVQGLTVCNLTCGPLLLLRLAGEGEGFKRGLRLSLMFSLPRMVLLTVLGAVLGAVGYSAAELSGVSGRPWFSSIVYLMISVVMIGTGLSFLGLGRTKLFKGRFSVKRRIASIVSRLGPRRGPDEEKVLMGVGILVSMLCFVEASAAVLSVASLLGIESDDVGQGIMFGAMAMLSYSIGLTLPLLALGSFASEIGKRLKRDDVRVVGGLMLVFLGGILSALSIYALYVSLRGASDLGPLS